MTTSRKKTLDLIRGTEEELVPEEPAVEEVIDELTDIIDESPKQVEIVPEAKPFVEETILPTPDPGPRFLEVTELTLEPAEPKPLPNLMPPPKRHPRNIPRFSRTR